MIQDNLFGLELDPRCTQIAAFNVAVAAWKLTGPRPLPMMRNIACTGLSVGVPRDQWMKVLEADGTSNLRFYFGQLYDMFSNASTLGSLINPNRFLGSQMLKKEDMDRLFRSLESVIASDPTTSPEQHELGVAAQGMARAAELLAAQYHVVLTNVPYLGRGKQDGTLSKHLDEQYAMGKADLATAFVLRGLEFCTTGGTAALVTPQNWLFLTTYKTLRESLLDNRQWNCVARLGPGAFETIGGHVVNVALLTLTADHPECGHEMCGIDVSTARLPEEKATYLRGQDLTNIFLIPQEEQLSNPDARISFRESTALPLLSTVADAMHGQGSFDSPCFVLMYWECQDFGSAWVLQQTAPESSSFLSGCNRILRWENGTGLLANLMKAKEREGYTTGKWRAGVSIWGRKGVVLSLMSTVTANSYLGVSFDDNTAVLVPQKDEYLPAIWAFAAEGALEKRARELDQKVNITCETLVKVPFDLAYWQQVALEKFPDGLPEPETEDPTQWIFHGRPDSSKSQVQVAIARLLGYRWPAELDPEMRLSDRARQLVQSCEALLPFADEDGVVCIPSVRGEETAAARLTRMLEACNLKPPHMLDDWLRNDFFQEHCDLFQQRPFIWHIWDGRKADGFHALVNYHKLAGPNGYKLLENLTYSYLGDWINRQESDVKRGESGADGRLAAAKTLQKQLVAILKGEPPYDIFVRWKPLHEQPIGWHPDINDGVRINIRPFMAVDIPGGRKGAGILRWGPKIKWTKDRGKEPKRPRDEYPWFWGNVDAASSRIDYDGKSQDGSSTFTGDRWNDCHYTNAFKQTARSKK